MLTILLQGDSILEFCNSLGTVPSILRIILLLEECIFDIFFSSNSYVADIKIFNYYLKYYLNVFCKVEFGFYKKFMNICERKAGQRSFFFQY
jgi:hypothetical protein